MKPTAGKPILQPSLMLNVGRDPVFTPGMTKGIEKFVPNVTVGFVEEAGHWVLQEQPDQVNVIICDWLKTLPSS
jgi:soluble epoxide hydrolase/lipid-phosphate phosphatase